jgi:hypothetical protein
MILSENLFIFVLQLVSCRPNWSKNQVKYENATIVWQNCLRSSKM